MSKASKYTFLASCVFTTVTIGTVFYIKDLDLETRRVGINRDQDRRSQQRIMNELEHIQQQELQKSLEKEQKVFKQTGS
jgi:hypothetical protein